MKSLLLVPGNSPSRWQAALDSRADTLVVDLADHVAMAPLAPHVTRSFLDQGRTRDSRPRLVVRISPLSLGSTDADLDLVMAAAPDAILLPRVVGGADIQHLAAKLAVHEALCGLMDGATRIIALGADTARGVLALGTIAGASRRLSGLGWRAVTACGEAAWLNAPDRLARALTLVAASAAEVDAIDAALSGPDLDALARDCETARRDGFVAKLAIDVSHVSIINAA